MNLHIFLLLLYLSCASTKKSVVDYSETDVERIYRQWEENDPDEDEDEDEMFKPPPTPGGLNLDNLAGGNIDPQQMMKLSKKGKPIMLFVGVRGQPDRTRTEQVSKMWAQSLHNAQLQVERYVVSDDRVLLLIQDGSLAWEVKDYLVTLTDCTTVSFEQQSFDCAGWAEGKTEL